MRTEIGKDNLRLLPEAIAARRAMLEFFASDEKNDENMQSAKMGLAVALKTKLCGLLVLCLEEEKDRYRLRKKVHKVMGDATAARIQFHPALAARANLALKMEM